MFFGWWRKLVRAESKGFRRERRKPPQMRRSNFKPWAEVLEDRTLLSAGDLDPTFGSGGKVVTSLGTSQDWASAVAIQGDGKAVVVGESVQGTASDLAVARYNTDGTLDASFGSGGRASTFLPDGFVPRDVAIQ